MENSLSNRALLVSVKISQWSGRKQDAIATNTVSAKHNTSLNAGSYTKKLLPKAKELETVNALAQNARKYFHENTLPWMHDGTRIISAKNHFNFAAEIRKLKSEYETAVEKLSDAYPDLKVNAKNQLGNLYDVNEYPQTIGDRYSFEIIYMPLPDVKDFRTEISDTEKQEFIAQVELTANNAMRDAWSRLHEVVKNAAEKLSKPDAIFRDSLIDNITKIVNTLPLLVISDDKNLENATNEVKQIVSKLRTDNLRANKTDREKAASDLSKIEKSLGAFMGCAK